MPLLPLLHHPPCLVLEFSEILLGNPHGSGSLGLAEVRIERGLNMYLCPTVHFLILNLRRWGEDIEISTKKKTAPLKRGLGGGRRGERGYKQRWKET